MTELSSQRSVSVNGCRALQCPATSLTYLQEYLSGAVTVCAATLTGVEGAS